MNTICKMRDIYKALSVFETAFEEMYAISLNEAMVLVRCAKPEKRLHRPPYPNERKWLRRIPRKSSVR